MHVLHSRPPIVATLASKPLISSADAERIWNLTIPCIGVAKVNATQNDLWLYRCNGCKETFGASVSLQHHQQQQQQRQQQRYRCAHLKQCQSGARLFATWKNAAFENYSSSTLTATWQKGLALLKLQESEFAGSPASLLLSASSSVSTQTDDSILSDSSSILESFYALFSNHTDFLSTMKRFHSNPDATQHVETLLNFLERKRDADAASKREREIVHAKLVEKQRRQKRKLAIPLTQLERPAQRNAIVVHAAAAEEIEEEKEEQNEKQNEEEREQEEEESKGRERQGQTNHEMDAVEEEDDTETFHIPTEPAIFGNDSPPPPPPQRLEIDENILKNIRVLLMDD